MDGGEFWRSTTTSKKPRQFKPHGGKKVCPLLRLFPEQPGGEIRFGRTQAKSFPRDMDKQANSFLRFDFPLSTAAHSLSVEVPPFLSCLFPLRLYSLGRIGFMDSFRRGR
jgi:hypothetical protein